MQGYHLPAEEEKEKLQRRRQRNDVSENSLTNKMLNTISHLESRVEHLEWMFIKQQEMLAKLERQLKKKIIDKL